MQSNNIPEALKSFEQLEKLIKNQLGDKNERLIEVY